jgi:hypothetical protein
MQAVKNLNKLKNHFSKDREDKTTMERILEISRFSKEDREHIFSVIDAFIAKRKIQSIL